MTPHTAAAQPRVESLLGDTRARNPTEEDTAKPDLAAIPRSSIPAANVASVPLRSPLRYPGGKTWLIPHVREWLSGRSKPPVLFEPFCGGAIVSLTAVMEQLVERCVLVELDRDVAAFWHATLHHTDALCERVCNFDATRQQVEQLCSRPPGDLVEHGFRTLVLNRTRHGGKLALGANLIRSGENGKGVASRWYPDTIVDRLRNIKKHAPRIEFHEGDGMQMFESMTRIEGAVAFIDPPYTMGQKRAGRRLYAYHKVDHTRIFEMLAESDVDFLMTYDAAPEIIALVRKHGFAAVQVTMKNTHHARLPELVVTRRQMFVESGR